MALPDDEKKKLREYVKGLDADKRAALIEALELSPDSSLADVLKAIEGIKADVETLKKSKPGESKPWYERIF